MVGLMLTGCGSGEGGSVVSTPTPTPASYTKLSDMTGDRTPDGECRLHNVGYARLPQWRDAVLWQRNNGCLYGGDRFIQIYGARRHDYHDDAAEPPASSV